LSAHAEANGYQVGNSNPVPTGSTECMESCGLKIARSSKAESQGSVGSRGAVQAQNTRVKNVAFCASTHTIHLRRRYPDSRRRTSRAFSKPPNTPQAAPAYIIKCPEPHIVFKPTLPLSCLLLKSPRSKAIPSDMVSVIPSPGPSRSSSQDQTKTPLTLDLSDLPPLVQPSPPSNTLIITVGNFFLLEASSGCKELVWTRQRCDIPITYI
jgi:hypothetical protein